MSVPIYHHKAIALGGLCWISMTNGLMVGQMTGMFSALQRNDEQLSLSENEISLIASSFSMITLVGFWSAAFVSDKIGRRWSFISFSMLLVIYWVILYIASDIYMFMLSRIIGGTAFGALFSLCICITSEYTSPNSRNFYLNMITTVAPAIGTGLGHFLVLITHWRNVALIGVMFTMANIILPYFWVESPHWLAIKGRFADCEQTFKKLHGNKSDKELRELIKLENCKLDAAKEVNSKNTLKKLLLAIKRRYFWELMVLTAVLYAYLAAAGKVVFSILGTVMLGEITGSSDVFLFTLFVDTFILIGSLLSCILIRKMSMRNLLFSTGFIANAVLIILSISLYFKIQEIYFQWINVSLLALYFIIINAGPYPVVEALMSEIFPLDLKLYCMFFSVITLNIFFTLSIVLFPILVASVGYHGMFLINVVIMSLSLAFIWVRLPETKGKTLQEIEVYFKTKDFNVDEVLNSVEMKLLI